ncbi:MAG: hypothetical protein L6R37_005830 [Teloschistes peruensis]|nr:MAG: hypothetical protein L6R37_005830 [Teloschistes peruensis]
MSASERAPPNCPTIVPSPPSAARQAPTLVVDMTDTSGHVATGLAASPFEFTDGFYNRLVPPEFRHYQIRVLANAAALEERLRGLGRGITRGGGGDSESTKSHQVAVGIRNMGELRAAKRVSWERLVSPAV